MLPLFHKVRYTPLGENPLRRRLNRVLLLKCAALATIILLLLALAAHFSGLNPTLSTSSNEEPPPPPEPEEGMLGFARGPRIAVPEIPKEFQTVGVVFYGRRSRVEILDCYLKVWLVSSCWGGWIGGNHMKCFRGADTLDVAKSEREWWTAG